ncbi:unnamed protein product [Adineta steineri]|uniref:ADP ribosyltransferase domain-containing protein n=1 Tax=Adineta steineri TaxID=433720 RepID=A0A815NE35_9BILA|nr:unnamed protein product [Adineta steineri]CAF1438230.1 unnamed protein product [Adineta steineri]
MDSKPSKPSLKLSYEATVPHIRQLRQRMAQNYLLLWVDTTIDETNEDYENALKQIQTIIGGVNIFNQRDACIDFLTDAQGDIKSSLIVKDTMFQQIMPLINDIPQLDGVYIYNDKKTLHEEWTEKWQNIKSTHTNIDDLCQGLQSDVKQYNQNSIAMSFITVNEMALTEDLNQLEPTFMYTQIFKDILLDMKHDEQAIKNFIIYCRQDNSKSKININLFEKEYRAQSAIWWYTYPSFIYSMLNDGLRFMEGDTIINMGFFIHDLHHQIQQLYQQQVNSYHGKPFIVYRGQGLSKPNFEKLQKTEGGLISFNSFLSTSADKEVSLQFAECASTDPNMVAILFIISIDPCLKSTPFAFINDLSHCKEENEILFSMHTVFRVGAIEHMSNENQLYQVELQLTSDDDQQLRLLTDRIREEVGDSTGWKRLGNLLLKIGQFNKAEELYNVLLEQTSNDGEKAIYHNQHGYVKDAQGDYEKAIWYYEKALEIYQKTLPPNHPHFATSYSNIGSAHDYMGEYSKALSFHEKAFEIYQKTLPPNHPDFATSYNNIGLVYDKLGEYLKALSFYEKALGIQEKTLPSNHPMLATSYNSIVNVYTKMGEYSKALSFYEKGLEIRQKALPPNHPDFAQSYNNVGSVYYNMEEYPKALSIYEKALEIYQKTFPSNHPNLATSYNNIGLVYSKMGECSKALSYYEKSLEIRQKTLPPNHPDYAQSYNNIGSVYDDMGEYSKALSNYGKALEIRQKTLPSHHPSLASSYNNIGLVYYTMGEYSKALSLLEKALEIYQKTLPPNHRLLSTSYNNIGGTYDSMEEYSKALSYYEKALEVEQKLLPSNPSGLAASYNNIGLLYFKMGEHSKALSYCEKALKTYQKTLPSNHPNLATSYNNIASIHYNMKDYSKALLFFEKALEIQQKTLRSNHPDLAGSFNNLGHMCYNTKEYAKALSYFEHALDIWQRALPPTHPNIKTVKESIIVVKKKL